MATATETKPKAKKVKAKIACQCNTKQVGTENQEPVFGPCGEQTTREFAPGHDARLKGVLIRAHLSGQKYRVKGDKPKDPMETARTRQWGGFLTSAEQREQARSEAKVKREQAKAEAKAKVEQERQSAKDAKAAAKPKAAAKATVSEPTQVKVGRVTYDIDEITAEGPNEVTVRYTDGSGNSKEKVVKRSALS